MPFADNRLIFMKSLNALTVAERIRGKYARLTRAERKLADVILENYPVSGLGSITVIANKAGVSAPTVIRMGKKVGFTSFPLMQAALHAELGATLSTPIAKHDCWAEGAPNTHILNRFADAVTNNMRQTLRLINPEQFDAAATLLTEQKRAVYIVGGRLTHALADYFFTHLQVIRGGTTLIAPNANTWPHYVLNMQKDDVVVLFDIRRYEHDTLRLAEMAKERRAILILFTDQWGSPVAKHATHSFHSRIEAPSAWDSSVVSLLIVESLIAAVQNKTWQKTRHRIKMLENLYDHTGMFKKFS